jgi:hypothetical protein
MKRAVLLVMSFLLAACSAAPPASPAQAVERYLQAKVAGDGETLRQLLCVEMEADWEREMHTFETISDVSLVGLACQQRGDDPVVDCQGKIVASYGSEQSEFPLGAYRVVQEAGEWKWCGETE